MNWLTAGTQVITKSKTVEIKVLLFFLLVDGRIRTIRDRGITHFMDPTDPDTERVLWRKYSPNTVRTALHGRDSLNWQTVWLIYFLHGPQRSRFCFERVPFREYESGLNRDFMPNPESTKDIYIPVTCWYQICPEINKFTFWLTQHEKQ